MGTRCLTVFKELDGKEICVMYRQFDGYVEGHGAELVDFLKDRSLVNGFGEGDERNFDGMGCLAASVVAGFKKETGGFYIYPAGARDCGEDYTYTVSPGAEGVKKLPSGRQKRVLAINIKVESHGETLYDGPVDSFAVEAVTDDE